MPRLAVSTWSLDGLLQAGTPLLELPRQLESHGITALELCRFHLPTTDSDHPASEWAAQALATPVVSL